MVDLATLLYPHTCTVTRITDGAVDAVNMPTETATTVSTTQSCRFEDSGTREIAKRYVVEIKNPRLFLPSGADVETSDRISAVTKDAVVIAAGPFEVVGSRELRDSPSSSIHHIELRLEQADG